MRLFHWGKDGGYESTVWGFWLCEFKSLFSIVLLCFENGTREAYHNHAFGSISWVLTGKLSEHMLTSRWEGAPCGPMLHHTPSARPIITRCSTFHQVRSTGRTWVLSFRGPWKKTWREYLPHENRFVTLTHGRRVVE
jgi:hypothetical protein